MRTTARTMHHAPASAYRAASSGDEVIINHDRYPEKIFVLTARDRNPLGENKKGPAQNAKPLENLELF